MTSTLIVTQIIVQGYEEQSRVAEKKPLSVVARVRKNLSFEAQVYPWVLDWIGLDWIGESN